MADQFKMQVFQNEYLPRGVREVHAILTVNADTGEAPVHSVGRLFGILLDVSGSMEGAKLRSAQVAIDRVIDLLPPTFEFFLIAGADDAQLLCPPVLADSRGKAQALHALHQLQAFGGTRMSNWLRLAAEQFRRRPEALRQALLLTDGQNDPTEASALQAALLACEGQFQCDCRGVGTDWQVGQLRGIAQTLLGTVDIVKSPAELRADFQSILERALAKSVRDVHLRLWTPRGATVLFTKQVSPVLEDLTQRARELGPQLREYRTGAWARGESRDFHLCLQVVPGEVGDEMLAGRASLLVTAGGVETKVAEGRILAIWTEDEARSTRIHRVVAHYTGQAELAESIHHGMEAKARGDTGQATALLGKAVRIAYTSGNEGTARLLRQVVEVEDANLGTVRLKQEVAREDAMALEARSTRTARLPQGGSA